MKKNLLIVLLAFIGFTAPAQDISLGLKGSFYSSWLFNKNISDQGDNLNYASTFSTTFGAQGLFMFSETYGLNTELVLASHKQKYDGYSGTEDNVFSNEIKLSYIDIPVLFRVSSPKGPYFELGPQMSLLTGARETFNFEKSDDNDYSDKDVKDDFAGFGISGILGFGVDIKLSDKINLTTGLRFGYMFTDATNEYTDLEAADLLTKDVLSNVAAFSHTTQKGGFDYARSNRAFGGVQIGIQYALGR